MAMFPAFPVLRDVGEYLYNSSIILKKFENTGKAGKAL
jgi:hypothetical protein